MSDIRKILIANRGEIAVRVMRTCRRMGIDTVAVFSDADADAPHVHLADEAVRLGPAPAAESYLAIERVLAAAARTGADAVHPGYGFLAENAAFARACGEAGLTFIGPSPEVIELLGSKRAAKQIVAAAGVPVVPGDDGGDQDTAALAARARDVGLPVLVKASAGGGGKGMRVVRADDDLVAAIESAKREARGAFGDDTLLIERYIERPRHIEFQILGDRHGALVHLFERECSIQRRHQKIIEEAPVLDDELRARMGAAAEAVGRAVGYYSAGTVEFILAAGDEVGAGDEVAANGQFYFLEVNTRLQVEHPVTELITGLDLVREQIRIARGEPLDLDVDLDLGHGLGVGADGGAGVITRRPRGAAVEVRLCAEDPGNGFLPTTGRLVDWHPPELEGVRVDSGVAAGQEIGIFYDSMLAKIICHGPTRAEAIARLGRALRELSVLGVVTNRALLVAILAHPAFRRGEVDTHFLDRHLDELLAQAPAQPDLDPAARAAIAVTLAGHEDRRDQRETLPALEPGFRNNAFADQAVEYELGETLLRARYRNLGGARFRIAVESVPAAGAADDGGDAPEPTSIVPDQVVTLVRYDAPSLVYQDQHGLRRRYRVVRDDASTPPRWWVHDLAGELMLAERPRFPERRAAAAKGGLIAPMPGRVVEVLVAAGQQVEAGDRLLVLEAMKMEHPLQAPAAGVVAELRAGAGDQVDGGQVLVVLTPA